MSKKFNDWDKLPGKVSGESDEMYEIRHMNKTDVNMINARRNFERPAYYTKFFKNKEQVNE